MADVAPMLPLRYDPNVLSRVVAPPYDVIDEAMRAELAARDPYNVVHIDLPEGNDAERYHEARRQFVRWQREGVLVRDDRPSFWRYVQKFDAPGGGSRMSRRGFFALVRAVPFGDGVVLPHQRTLTGPIIDRMALSRATRATLSPQFLLYSDPECALDRALAGDEPFADFTTSDGIRHELSRVADPDAVSLVCSSLATARLVVADGHHRYETAVALAEELEHDARARGTTPLPRGEHRYTFALLANGDDPDLVVFGVHRLVHSLDDFDFDRMVAGAAPLFEAHPISGTAVELERATRERSGPALCAVGRDGRAVLLVFRGDADLSRHPLLGRRPESVRGTCAALLQDGILEPILGLGADSQTGRQHLRFVEDAALAIGAIERGEAQVLFIVPPAPVARVRSVAEDGDVLPPKSTLFYPKVPTGLFFHTLSTERAVP